MNTIVKSAVVGAALAASLVAANPASAASGITPQMIADAMRGAGYQAEILAPKDDAPPMIRTGIGGKNVRLIFYGCGDKGCQDFQIRGYFDNERRLDHAAVNSLNVQARFLKVYLDRDGDLTLEMDTDLEGGATPQTAVQSLRVFNQFMGTVLRAIDGMPGPGQRRQESGRSRPGASRLSGEPVDLDHVPGCLSRRCRDI